MQSHRSESHRTPRLPGLLGLCLLGLAIALPAAADDVPSPAAINSMLHQQLEGSASESKIETVSGQMYISQEHIDAGTISDALARMLDAQQGEGDQVAVRRGPRLNFEIHFQKNSAELTEDSRKGLDELGQVLASDYLEMRFVLGGHTDLDGDESVNGPLSQARADVARSYLVERHSIDGDRLVAKGFGMSEPLREVEQSAQDKLYNRRVDLRPMR